MTVPLSPSFNIHATVSVSVGTGQKVSDSLVAGSQSNVATPSGAGRRGKDPARKIDVTSPALLVEQPGSESRRPAKGLPAVDRLDADFPDAVQSQCDRLRDSPLMCPPPLDRP